MDFFKRENLVNVAIDCETDEEKLEAIDIFHKAGFVKPYNDMLGQFRSSSNIVCIVKNQIVIRRSLFVSFDKAVTTISLENFKAKIAEYKTFLSREIPAEEYNAILNELKKHRAFNADSSRYMNRAKREICKALSHQGVLGSVTFTKREQFYLKQK